MQEYPVHNLKALSYLEWIIDQWFLILKNWLISIEVSLQKWLAHFYTVRKPAAIIRIEYFQT